MIDRSIDLGRSIDPQKNTQHILQHGDAPRTGGWRRRGAGRPWRGTGWCSRPWSDVFVFVVCVCVGEGGRGLGRGLPAEGRRQKRGGKATHPTPTPPPTDPNTRTHPRTHDPIKKKRSHTHRRSRPCCTSMMYVSGGANTSASCASHGRWLSTGLCCLFVDLCMGIWYGWGRKMGFTSTVLGVSDGASQAGSRPSDGCAGVWHRSTRTAGAAASTRRAGGRGGGPVFLKVGVGCV